MSQTAQVKLNDGRSLIYEIHSSPKAKSVRLKMTIRDGLTVFAPQGLSKVRVAELVEDKQHWISQKLSQFDQVRNLLGETPAGRPQAFDLAAIAESWRVEYRATRSMTVGARTELPGRLIVFGATQEADRCNAALRRWLARRAKEVLGARLAKLALETGLQFKRFTIKCQKSRWGSCSAAGIISLNCKLLFLEPDLVRYVLIHELCHLQEPNHSKRYWMFLRHFEPNADQLHERMAESWKRVPPWAQARQTESVRSD